MNAYNSLADDFGVLVHLASKAELPSSRETVLGFFDAARRVNPNLTDFEVRDGQEFVLEEDREAGSYRWLSLSARRLSLGYANPPSMAELDRQNEWVLEAAPAHLNMTGLDTESIDVIYYFDLNYAGNHDEVVAEAIAGQGPFEQFAKLQPSKVLFFQPSMMLALDESCQLQCRVSVETRTTAYQVRTGSYADSPISVYITMRQFWGRQPFKDFQTSYHNQRQLLDEIVTDQVIPQIVQPLARTIATK